MAVKKLAEPRFFETPEEFRALIESDLKRWGKVVKDAGITVQ